MGKKTLEERLADYEGEILIADGFDDAFIGIGRRCSQPPIAVYSRKKCIESLVKRGMEEDEAEEYYEFNVVGAWVGKQTPIFVEELDDE